MRTVPVTVAAAALLATAAVTGSGPAAARPTADLRDGPWHPDRPVFGMSTATAAEFTRAETALGIQAGVVSTFTDFVHGWPTWEADAARARGAALLVALEPWNWDLGIDQPDHQLADLTTGAHDATITAFAAWAASTGVPVLVRFAPEMNGDWRPWSLGVNGNPVDGAAYIAAWRHVYTVAEQVNPALTWVFNPITSYEDGAGRGYPHASYPLADLYPGDDVVDWVGLDGYNWGATRPWGWQSYLDIFTIGLAEIRAVAPSKPLMLAEVGCAPGPGKAAWVTDTLTRADADDIQMVAWFERDKETDWRLTSAKKVAAAAKTVLSGWRAP